MPLQDLPLELAEQILLRLPLPDLVHLTSLSSFLHDLIHNSHLLWTHHLRTHNLNLSSDSDGGPNNLHKFRERYECVRGLDVQLEKLSHQHLRHTLVEIDVEQDNIVSCLRDPARREITYRHLSSILKDSNKFTRLTAKYYARYLLVAHTQAGIIQELSRPSPTFSPTRWGLLEGSLLISRWVGACMYEPGVIYNTSPTECIPVRETIEAIVNQCRAHLAPTAPVEEVLRVINKVLYREFGLTKDTENYYDFDNNRIDRVLYKKSGIPITISILYYEIGTRLGLSLNLINFPRHFLLSFRSTTGTTMYIDCFNEGDILSRAQCLQLCPMAPIDDKDYYFQTASCVHVLKRLIANILMIVRSPMVSNLHDPAFFVINMYKIISWLAPDDYETAIQAMNFSHERKVLCKFLRNFSCVDPETWNKYSRRMKVVTSDSDDFLRVKSRKPEQVLFDIGWVMLHKRYNYTCVVYGWDECCMMNSNWQNRMGISQLEHQGNQPYYQVLADDDSERYVAQENLLETRSVFIPHRDVGKYFDLYDGERFVPNAALRTIYTYLGNG